MEDDGEKASYSTVEAKTITTQSSGGKEDPRPTLTDMNKRYVSLHLGQSVVVVATLFAVGFATEVRRVSHRVHHRVRVFRPDIGLGNVLPISSRPDVAIVAVVVQSIDAPSFIEINGKATFGFIQRRYKLTTGRNDQLAGVVQCHYYTAAGFGISKPYDCLDRAAVPRLIPKIIRAFPQYQDRYQ